MVIDREKFWAWRNYEGPDATGKLRPCTLRDWAKKTHPHLVVYLMRRMKAAA